MKTILVALVIATLSPLLTFAALWQTKEWRVDRLREHLVAEGWLRQLFGFIRPLILLLSPVFAFVPGLILPWWSCGVLLLAVLSLVQIGMGRQRTPVWTMKARILVTVSVVLTTVIGYWLLVTGDWILVLLPLLQPLIFTLSWSLFYPIDRTLKRRILNRATMLRREYANATVIGITGSAGKTTTKELLGHILEGEHTLVTPAYVNTEMGVAQWLLKELPLREPEEKLTIIVEMGAYREGEIKLLCSVAQPQIGVLTLIGSQHIALFGSSEKLLRAKSEILSSLPVNGRGFINADCTPCLEAAKKAPCPIMAVSTGGHADLEAHHIEETSSGIAFSIGDERFTVPLHGTHNVINVLLAIAVAEYLGVSHAQSSKKLRTFVPPHSTFALRRENGVTLLDDTHNSSPQSFRAALAWAKSQPMSEKILITPGIIELGEATDRIHAELGAAAQGIVDRVIFTGKRGREAFARGYGKPLESLQAAHRVSPGALLLCVGRIGPSTINALLPQP